MSCVPQSIDQLFFILKFASLVLLALIYEQIKPPSSSAGRFTQILSIGIGGSALGPQFVAEALAPDIPPLKVYPASSKS